MSATLEYGDGEQVYLEDSADAGVAVTFDDVIYCATCGEEVVEEFDGYTHAVTSVSACFPDDPTSEDELRVQTTPDLFANSASIVTTDDQVTVAISVGDPRGAFTMTVRRMPNGQLILHVPYAGMGMSHMNLREVMPGTFEIK